MNAKKIEYPAFASRPVLSLPNPPKLLPDASNDAAFSEPPARGGRRGWDDTKLTITRKPRPGQVYFIAAASGARAPEFEGYHPGVIIRVSPHFTADACTVVYVPLTRHEPDGGSGRVLPYIHQLSAAPGPDGERPAWAVCDHIMTANVCRLERFHYPGEGPRIPDISREDFRAINECLGVAMPSVRNQIEARMIAGFDREREELLRRHAEEVARLKGEYDERMAAREFELMDDLTSPKKVD